MGGNRSGIQPEWAASSRDARGLGWRRTAKRRTLKTPGCLGCLGWSRSRPPGRQRRRLPTGRLLTASAASPRYPHSQDAARHVLGLKTIEGINRVVAVSTSTRMSAMQLEPRHVPRCHASLTVAPESLRGRIRSIKHRSLYKGLPLVMRRAPQKGRRFQRGNVNRPGCYPGSR